MLPKLLRVLWGDLSGDEIKKFSILAATLFCIIGIYWMVRVMKDATFDLLVGFEWQPFAKIASLVFVGILIFFYSKLVDIFEKQTLFYLICSIYVTSFLIISYLIGKPHLTEVKEASMLWPIFKFIPGNILGWITYVFIESFGSIVVALFWAFVASTTTSDSAKRGYGMVVSLTQFGTILGPWVVQQYSETLGIPRLFAIGGFAIILVPLLIKLYVSVIPSNKVVDSKKKTPTGFFEGIRLLFSHTYLIGILAVATLYEIISTILEFQMGMIVKVVYPTKLDGGAAFSWFKAWNAMSIGILALVFALFGTSFLMRRFGLKFCLITFPASLGVIVLLLFLCNNIIGVSQYQLMWLFFVSMFITKALNYALNNPSKEVMYIPTSRDVKFKTKGWIDAFGTRTSKGAGAVVTGSLGDAIPTLFLFGTIISLGVVGVWVFMAAFVGNKFVELQKTKEIIE